MRRELAALTLACAAAFGACAFPTAQAGTADYILPQRWNDDYAPGSSCATPGAGGIYVTASRRWFDQTDAASVANRSAVPVPVKQKVKQARTTTLQVSVSAQPQGELTSYISAAYGFTYLRVQHWSVGQTVGPYQLGPGRQGTLVWGFMMLDTDNQNVRCSADKVWIAEGAPYSATVPESRYAELREDQLPVFG